MHILLIADTESAALWEHYDKTRLAGIDLILSAGDVDPDYLQFLVTMGRAPLLYVHGNHDEIYDRRPPLGCTCIDDRVYDFRGLRILGLGGSMRYGNGKYMYTEREMQHRVRRLQAELCLKNGFDLLLTHAPAEGYGDLQDLPHRGFSVFNRLLAKYRPKYLVYGHVHRSYGDFQRQMVHTCGTILINAYEKYELTVQADEYPAEGRTGSFLYDLYTGFRRKGGSSL